jgi:polygalacturonase
MEDNASQSGALTVGWRGTTFCLVGINGFEISGLNIQKNLSWSVNIVGCCNGSIHDIVFDTIRENGDGIDLLKAHDISIYNISGTTQDDTIAVSSCDTPRYDKRPAERNVPIVPIYYGYNKFGSDTYNIFIKDVNANGTNHVLILITGTHEVYNITAVGLSDTYNNTSGKNAIVKIYGGQYNGDYHHGLIHNCCISDIVANNCATAAVWLSEGLIQHGIIHNVTVPSGRTTLKNQSGANLQDYDMVVD